MNEQPKCELCGHPMPKGEEMFKYHGYSGPCPGDPMGLQEPSSNEAIRRDFEGWLPPRPHWTEVCFEAYCAGRLDEKTHRASQPATREVEVWNAAIEAAIAGIKRGRNYCDCLTEVQALKKQEKML